MRTVNDDGKLKLNTILFHLLEFNKKHFFFKSTDRIKFDLYSLCYMFIMKIMIVFVKNGKINVGNSFEF